MKAENSNTDSFMVELVSHYSFPFSHDRVGCYKFGDPLLVEEGEDSLDEEGGRGEGIGGRGDDDSDDQFADDEAASNQGDSSSQEYLEDHYAGEELLSKSIEYITCVCRT